MKMPWVITVLAAMNIGFCEPLFSVTNHQPVYVGKDTSAPVLYLSTTKLPQYPGGAEAVKRFIISNFRWPSEDISFDGSVIVSFIIEDNGRLSNIKVVSCKVPAIEKEIIRVFSLMPSWAPGASTSGKVRTLMFFPVAISLMKN